MTEEQRRRGWEVFCSSGVLLTTTVGHQPEQASWWLFESKLEKLVAPTTDIEPVPELDYEIERGRVSGGESGAGGGGRPSGVWTRGGKPYGLFGFARFGEKSVDSSQPSSRHLPEESKNLAWKLEGMELNTGGYIEL